MSEHRQPAIWHAKSAVLATVLVLATALAVPAGAVPANPEPALITQPDGTRIRVFLRGDERSHWHEDADGYLVARAKGRPEWVYAEERGGRIIPTAHALGKANPRALGLSRPNPRRIVENTLAELTSAYGPEAAQLSAPGDPLALAPRTGMMKNLVLLVNFSDLTIPYTRQQFDDLFNQIGYNADGAVGSVKDYYHQVSYNQLTVDSVVVEPVTLDYGYAYYGADSNGSDIRPREMVKQALAKLEARGFDFRTVDSNGDKWVDGLTVIHAGGGQEYSGNDTNYIWSHKWAMSSLVTYDGIRMQDYHTEPARRGFDSSPSSWGMTRIGVVCHENGHFLGLPDLYDTGYDSSGVGRFCLMASGSWGGGDGRQPTHMSAWCKAELGWLVPTPIASAGSYSLARVEDNPQVYKLQGPFGSSEYFLLENRQGYGFDGGLPGSQRGMLIWHIDETRSNNNDQAHYKVDLEEASGTQHLELAAHVNGDDADYFRSSTLSSFTDTTTPNNLSYAGVSVGLPVSAISASGPVMTFIQGTDNTPPSAPGRPTDSGAYTSSTYITFSWTAAADTFGVARYNVQVGTTPGGSNVFSGSVGNVLATSVTGSVGNVYYCRAQAVDAAGNAGPWSEISDGIAVVQYPGSSVGQAKGRANGTSVGIGPAVVQGVFNGFFYISDLDGPQGVRVVPGVMPSELTAGQMVDVGGRIWTGGNGERYIEGAAAVR